MDSGSGGRDEADSVTPIDGDSGSSGNQLGEGLVEVLSGHEFRFIWMTGYESELSFPPGRSEGRSIVLKECLEIENEDLVLLSSHAEERSRNRGY